MAKPLKILCVGSNREQTFEMQYRLCDRGHTVMGTEDGQSLLEMLPVITPHIVVVAGVTPTLTGLSVLQWIRGSALFMNLPVVVLGEDTEAGVRQTVETLDGRFLLKSVSKDGFVAAVEEEALRRW